MNLEDLGKTVAKFAPALGALLPIPGGAAIGAAIAAAFGGNVNDPEALMWKINQDPQAAVKLIEIQNNTKVSMRQADVEDYKSEVDDRKSARDRETKLALAGIQNYVQEVLAIIIIVGSIFILFQYMKTPTVESEKIVLGMFGLCTLILSYYFGSSPAERRNAINNAANDNRLDLPTPKFKDAA